MENKIESEIQDMILKQKIHYVGRLNKLRYPKTTAGRKRYIKDSLSGIDATPKWFEVIICLILLPLLVPLLIYAGVKWLWFHIVRYYYRYMS